MSNSHRCFLPSFGLFGQAVSENGFLFDLLEPWEIRALSIRKTAHLPLQLCVGTFPRFVAIGFYFIISFCADFSCRWNCLFCRIRLSVSSSMWFECCLRIIPPFDFHFEIYKRDLAIQTEWWEQRIVWWKLLNAARQIIWSIICIRKQQCANQELERQIRCFPYVELSDVPRL
jgi:hypothetical protein